MSTHFTRPARRRYPGVTLSPVAMKLAHPQPQRRPARRLPVTLCAGLLVGVLATSMPRPARADVPARAAAEPRADAAADAMAGGAPDRVADEPSALGLGFARHLERLVNEHRARHGLPALEVAAALTLLAAEHSADMAASQRLSHGGFTARLQRARSRACVENVGWNHATPESLLDGWRLSPAHARNLLDPALVRMGVAVSARYVTFFACR